MTMRVVCLIGGLLAAGGGLAQVSSPPSAMIFFDWGKTTIGRDYAEALDASVVDYLKRPGGRVIIESHSDGSGSASSNLASARLRGNAVRSLLVARGVPASSVELIARG